MFTTSTEVYDWLNSFLSFERTGNRLTKAPEYRLDRMEVLKAICSHPDSDYSVAHIAGSKGKGSTATMLSFILQHEYYKNNIGLYTSPHILSFTERIAINNKPIDDADIVKSANVLKSTIDKCTKDDFPGRTMPTYFELLTMLAFISFKVKQCSHAVIEVGLGGRLDSTNVVHPDIAIITAIELEHCELLGNTIELIAGEKAGIIKQGVPVCTSADEPEALNVIRNKAIEKKAELYELDKCATIQSYNINKHGTQAIIKWHDTDLFSGDMEINIKLIGKVQIRNAILAAMAAKVLGCSTSNIVDGLSQASLHARFEIVSTDPYLIVDAAHTAQSIKASLEDFLLLFDKGILLFACAIDKDPNVMANILRHDTKSEPVFKQVFITRPGSFKESDIDAIFTAFNSAGFNTKKIESTQAAIDEALAYAKKYNLPLLVTGSFYLASEVFKARI